MTGKVRIRKGAVVFQDRRFPVWGRDIGENAIDMVFDVISYSISHDRFDVCAYGYGYRSAGCGSEAYGNGGLFVNFADVIMLSQAEIDALPPFVIPEAPPKPKEDVFQEARAQLSSVESLPDLTAALAVVNKALNLGERSFKELQTLRTNDKS